ncbi:MAG: aminoglycoside phosphotransferase family protein [Gammaproteobacteria bacterium]|jgi:aminoglycoside phosphotransferase (APT) family kinase protein/phosphate uptake regulator
MTKKLPKSIRDNLRFLSVEVDSQIANLQACFSMPSPAVARRILDRSGYAYNLKMRIHNSCTTRLASCKEGDPETLTLRAVEFIATDLERITELCRDCVKQMDYVTDINSLQPEKYGPILDRVRRGIELLEPAIQENDTRLALKIGQIEGKLDRDYNKLLKHYIAALKEQKNTEDLASGLFLAHSVEQMGDALLDVSESIISANLGQPVNFERYQSLRASVEQLDTEEDIQIEPIAETRSGSAIAGITAADKEDEYVAIFKEGEKRKVKEERKGVKSWHEIYPGLAPRILSYQKRGESAALLIEHLPGLTFEQILLNEPPELLKETLDQLGKTLKSVWRETRTDKPVCANFMQQLEKRLDDVYKIHPEFQQSDSIVGDLTIPSFDTLVAQARDYETGLQAPFSVYIHGDFNVDNIIYDPMEQRINFIDLHRSRYMDYVQDVSVFMVSNYRLQILDAPRRRRIMKLARDFYRMARRYARKAEDATFELRLALGLARSFATSTRFILDKSLARDMFLRARYLIEQVLAVDPGKAANYKIPVKEIFVG